MQGRLPQELALAGITGMAAANAHLRETFWPRMNRRFGVEAAERGSAFVALGDVDLEDILCLKEERTVTRDNCVGCRGRHYVKRRVRVHEHADGTLLNRAMATATIPVTATLQAHRQMIMDTPLQPTTLASDTPQRGSMPRHPAP